jgi:uncharacterized protein YgbK (DUF1537 family)
MRVAIVADDLTGALDAAAPFAHRGAATEAYLPGADLPPPAERAAVISLSTESRNVTATIALERLQAALAQLAAEPRLLFKKIDSTLRGHVVAETLACMRDSGRRHAVITPAAPAQGRVMRGGELFVHGQHLRDTPMAQDRLAPPPQVSLAQAFAGREAQVHAITDPGAWELSSAAGSHVYVVDCASDADLQQVAQRAVADPSETLLVGTSGLAAAAAELCLPNGALPNAVDLPAAALLFVVGSRTPQSAAQVANLMTHPGVHLVTLGENPMPAAAMAHTPCRVLAIDQTVEYDALVAAARLAEAAQGILDAHSIGLVIVTGGDTAQALLRRLGVNRVQVLDEFRPGIALCLAHHAGRRLLVITKAGGFGDVDLFAEVARRFAAVR